MCCRIRHGSPKATQLSKGAAIAIPRAQNPACRLQASQQDLRQAAPLRVLPAETVRDIDILHVRFCCLTSVDRMKLWAG